MQLAVFDIDGTLTDTVGLCDGGFGAAVADVAGVPHFELVPELWGDATDSGLAVRHFRHAVGREPTDLELQQIQARFTAHLEEADVVARPVPGAERVLASVGARSDWTVAVATGNWLATARIKFRWAGMPVPDLPMGTADDALRRADILHAAIDRAGQGAGVQAFTRVVYLGDGAHDVAAARTLGIPFIGVTATRDEEGLRAAGARCFLRDFHDTHAVESALKTAAVPDLPRDSTPMPR